MRERLIPLRQRMLPALTEWFLLLPVWFPLSILMFRASGPGPIAAATAAAVALAALLPRIVPIRKVWQHVLVALLFAAAAWALWPGPAPERLGAGALVGACAARALLYGMRDWQALLRPTFGWISLILYFFAGFFFQHSPLLTPYRGAFAACGVAALVVAMVISNTMYIRSTALSREREETSAVRPILRTNRLYLTVLFVLILGLSLYESIWHFLTTTLYEWLVRLLTPSGDMSLPEPETPSSAPPPQMGLVPGDGEPSRLAKILETVFLWLIYAVLLALAVVGLVFAARGVLRLYRYVLRLLGRTVEQTEDAGYVDEKESLLDRVIKDNRARWDRLWNRWTEREPKWEELADNRERARFLFRHWLGRMRKAGFAWHSPDTPEEIFRAADHFAREGGGAAAAVGGSGRLGRGAGRPGRAAGGAGRSGRDPVATGPHAAPTAYPTAEPHTGAHEGSHLTPHAVPTSGPHAAPQTEPHLASPSADRWLSRETALRAYHKARYGPPDVEPTAAEIERMREELAE